MEKVICDRCGQEIETGDRAVVSYNDIDKDDNFDYCKKCKLEVWKFLTSNYLLNKELRTV